MKSRHISRVEDYVCAHIGEKITVAEIAEALRLNPSYLNTCFSSETHCSIKAYIRRKKTELAKAYLSNENYSLAQICTMLGYFDQSHFSRTFRKEVGMTPGAYRAKYLLKTRTELQMND